VEVELTRTYRFEAAHLLPNVPEGHKCRRLHGHSFVIDVTARGEVDRTTGWLVDYADMDAAFEPVHAALDHRYLNEIPGLENATSEVLAAWIWDRLGGSVPGLWRITVRETCDAACAYYGPGDLPGRSA
jgi:6-pyruvoyltetrahydropterin/6-carboxytetrahydropterin synthase